MEVKVAITAEERRTNTYRVDFTTPFTLKGLTNWKNAPFVQKTQKNSRHTTLVKLALIVYAKPYGRTWVGSFCKKEVLCVKGNVLAESMKGVNVFANSFFFCKKSPTFFSPPSLDNYRKTVKYRKLCSNKMLSVSTTQMHRSQYYKINLSPDFKYKIRLEKKIKLVFVAYVQSRYFLNT